MCDVISHAVYMCDVISHAVCMCGMVYLHPIVGDGQAPMESMASSSHLETHFFLIAAGRLPAYYSTFLCTV